MRQVPAALFEAFKRGDDLAFTWLFKLYHRSLYLIVLGIIKDSEEVTDIVSNSFIKLFSNRASINDADHVEKYLFIVARNEAIDCLRKRHVRRKAQDELALGPEPEYEEPLESEIVFAKLMEKISLVVQKLPERRKKIFLLHYNSGMNTREIARKLDIAEQTVRNQLARAIIQLRHALQ